VGLGLLEDGLVGEWMEGGDWMSYYARAESLSIDG